MTTVPAAGSLARRLQDIPESVTMAISAKARSLRAAGHDVITFGVGEPDFPTPAHIVEAAREACGDPVLHHYTAAAGLPALREAVARKTERDSGLVVSPEQVVITGGAKHALYNAFQALVDPGDEVLLPAPYWVTYPEQIRLAGGVARVLPTGARDGYRVALEQLEEACTPRTKALVFCSPSNPSGAVYPPEEVERIGHWAAERGLWVITDEIYEHFVYGGARFVSMPRVVPELAERCVVVNGVSKTYAMTGWRLGWSITPLPLARAIVRLQSHLASNVGNVSQAAALAALEGPFDVMERMRATYDRRRRVAYERLSAMDGLLCPEPEGAFYVFPSVEGLFGRAVAGRAVASSLDLCDALLDSARVALVPGEGFGTPGALRLSYVASDDDLARGLDRIAEALAA